MSSFSSSNIVQEFQSYSLPEGLPSGIYLIRLEFKNKDIEVRKIIIK